MASPILIQMIQRLGRLPGLGPRSGRRVAFFLLKNKDRLLRPLIEVLQKALDRVHPCPVCGYLDEQSPCHLCQDTARDAHALCVVSDVGDVWALEKTRSFKGRYHVLGGNLSVMDGVGPKHLRIEGLLARLKTDPITEVVLALSPTVEGSATTHFVIQEIQKAGLTPTLTSLARGIPLGGELDFLDEGTLSEAFRGRKSV
jgi:recombination protein RecR